MLVLALALASGPARADVCMNPFSYDRPTTQAECWSIYNNKKHKCVGACVADCEQFENTCNSLPAEAPSSGANSGGAEEGTEGTEGTDGSEDWGEEGGEEEGSRPSLTDQIRTTWTGKLRQGIPVGYGAFSDEDAQLNCVDGADCTVTRVDTQLRCYLGEWGADWTFEGEQWTPPSSVTACDPREVPRAFSPKVGQFRLASTFEGGARSAAPAYDDELMLYTGQQHQIHKVPAAKASGDRFVRRCVSYTEGTADRETYNEPVACELPGFKSAFVQADFDHTQTRELPLLSQGDEGKAQADKGSAAQPGGAESGGLLGCSVAPSHRFGWLALSGALVAVARRRLH